MSCSTTRSIPYTLGLMNSVPRIGVDVKEPLHPIAGLPPDLRDPPKGCRFRPRCPRRTSQCEETPKLERDGAQSPRGMLASD